MKFRLSVGATLIIGAFSANLATAASGVIDYWAVEGIEYSSIIVKLKKEKVSQRSVLNQSVIQSNKLMLESGAIDVSPLYNTEDKRSKNQSVTDALDDKYGFDLYYKIDLPASKTQDINYINALLAQIEKEKNIEIAYPDSKVVTRYNVIKGGSVYNVTPKKSSVPDFTSLQYYLRAPEDRGVGYKIGGINYDYAKGVYGGEGEGLTVVSQEGGAWNNKHVDLPDYAFKVVKNGTGPDINYHDTSSVGIMGGKDNGFGITGIANKSKFGYLDGNSLLYDVLDKLEAGDVVQIGQQTNIGPIGNCASNCLVPIEVKDHFFADIKAATDKGIHVIQAAGNGNVNLDDPAFKGKFDRKIRDSGSIIVGALSPQSGGKAGFSTYGSRVDSASWGEDVVSTTHDGGNLWNEPDAEYTNRFRGTSSANPIVAGAAASLSGVAKANGIKISPKALRQLLTETGTQLINDDSSKIGTQPDLRKAINKLLKDYGEEEDIVNATLQNGNAEAGNLNGWRRVQGQFRVIKTQDGIKPASGNYFFTGHINDSAADHESTDQISQKIKLDQDLISLGKASATLRFKSNGWGDGDYGTVKLLARDNKGNAIKTASIDTQALAKKWLDNKVSLTLPAKASVLEILVQAMKRAGSTSDVQFDDFELTLGERDIPVPPNNLLPVAKASASPAELTGAGTVTLSGAGSYDPDKDALSYHWQQTAGPAAILKNPGTLTASVSLQDVKNQTSYRFKLTVTDTHGAQSSQDTTILQKVKPTGGAPEWSSTKKYIVACEKVSWQGKEWLNGWWIQGTEPGSDGLSGVWRPLGASNMHDKCK